MRYGILAAMALSWVLAGSTCVPLVDLDQVGGSGFAPTTTLAVSVLTPDQDRAVALGTVVTIEWTAVNMTGSEAVATILVRERRNFADTVLVGGVRVEESGGAQTLDWDTADFPGGEYSVVARIEAGGLVREASAAGRVTLNTPPSFTFTEPLDDTSLSGKASTLTQKGDTPGATGDPNAANPANDPNAAGTGDPNDAGGQSTVTIGWTAFDPDGDGNVQIGIDPDLDHESGNETIIADRQLPESREAESIDWDGTDVAGENVEGGTYNLFAIVADGVNEDQIVEGLARITVPQSEQPPDPTALAITAPSEDTQFLTSDDPLTIEYTLSEGDDVLVDLKVDTDDNHQNGNEITILSQRLIEQGTTEDSFDWDGSTSSGNAVEDGIYRLFLVVNRGTATPAVAPADALIFRRSEENQPLIALLAPGTNQTVEGGAFVTIQWRDEDPNEAATVRLTIDDDDTPAEEIEADGNPEIEILAFGERDASGDGVQDSFVYQVPADLEPGRYYIFAYIDRDGVDPFDNISVAAGQIIIEDPTAGDGG